MDHQVRNITKSCYHQLRNIGGIRPLISESASKTLVCSLVTSRLDYGNALIHGECTSSLSRLQRVQNTAARIITRTRKYDHITPVLVKLHWLPIEQRIQYKLILQAFKALHGTSPFYMQELVQVYKPNRSLRSENSMHLVQSRARTRSYGDRRLDVVSSTLWETFPKILD
ncbi:uncharacterized protein LOC128187403 [Crassostrea angulata]|uniref:uncharacterized protein LOC128187403 n=1 Tax=Magallana angulata TaxID=2784310 RepID=UPI0022B1298F|nr:uncharacterized protein LOC128187403 [Crassostrea angulata]